MKGINAMELERIWQRVSRHTGLLVLILCLPTVAFSQDANAPSPLTLQQALNIALEKNPQRKAALADTKAAAADVATARSFLLPHITFSESAERGNDPVYVFGSKLRQQRFTTGDFALNVLNEPDPYENFGTRFGGTWTLFDSFASWHGVTRAQHMKDAALRQLERANQEIVFHVVDSYYGVLLAKRRLDVAEESLKTARAIIGRAKDRYESGIVVQSDYLSAEVRMATRTQDLIRAQDDLSLAQAQLCTAMGVPTSNEFDPTEALAEKHLPVPSLDDLEKQAMEKRPDLNQIRSEEAAQQQSVSMAKSAFGPRVNAHAGWQADNPTMFAGGGGNSWVTGIEVQFDLFQGGAKRSKLSHERAIEEKVSAAKEAATDEIQLEVRRAYYDLDVARRKVDVARATIAEANESLRINQVRYDSGLSTITDLLAAEEAAHRSQADYWEAVYSYHTGYANLELTCGTLGPQSPLVKP